MIRLAKTHGSIDLNAHCTDRDLLLLLLLLLLLFKEILNKKRNDKT